jgi:uncharacterized protein (DUF169 family)
MDSPSWPDIAGRLTSSLGLNSPPIAITFAADVPEDVQAYAGPKPPPAPDGRTGPVPAGCVFWTKALDRTFSTVASDHANCSVGTLVHGFASLDEVAGNSDVAAILDSGWVTMEQIPAIPIVQERPGSVTYGPLTEASATPDVVLIRISAGQLMLLAEAVPELKIGGKPQCHVVAAAKQNGEVAASLGCTLSRSRTGQADDEMTCAIPVARLAEVVTSVEEKARIDAVAEGYAAADLQRFAEF